MVPTGERLTKLRELMAARGLHAYYVPSEDAHQVNGDVDCRTVCLSFTIV